MINNYYFYLLYNIYIDIKLLKSIYNSILINNLLYMNKILILLSLIYLTSCKLACSSKETPEKREDCYNRAVDDENNGICCYLKLKLPFTN